MHVSTIYILHAAFFILHVHVPTITCLLLRTLYTSHVHCAVGSLPLANNAMHSPSNRKIAASCTTRLARSITGAAHTVIPIERHHAHKIATSIHLTTFIQCTRDRYRRKMRLASERHDYPDAYRARRAAVFAGDETLSRL